MPFGKNKEIKNISEQNIEDSSSSRMFDFAKKQTGIKKNYDSQACLGVGSKIEGRVYFDGVAEVFGEVDGEIVSTGNLIIAESALIKAQIKGNNITVYGKVYGDIFASEKIALKQPAFVIGNVKTPILSMEEGVLFKGECQMEAMAQEQSFEKEK